MNSMFLKLITLFLSILFLFIISGCGTNEKGMQFKRLSNTDEDGYMITPEKKKPNLK